MADPVVGFEITVQDAKKMKAFYAKAFGWKFSQGIHKGVHAVAAGKRGPAGSLLERGDFIPDYVSLYIEVADLGKSIAKVQKAGGGIIRPPFQPDAKTELAIVSDPEGHVLTLKRAKARKKA
jgi:predicted enzyme related to lactoylglutathione lyase